jgi:hypothetical protein
MPPFCLSLLSETDITPKKRKGKMPTKNPTIAGVVLCEAEDIYQYYYN